MMLVRSGPHILLIPPFSPSTWKILNQILMAPMGTGIIRNKANELAQAAARKIDLSGSNRPIVYIAAHQSAEQNEKDHF
jgi:hypothetical protein